MNGRLAILAFLLVLPREPVFACTCAWTTTPSADYGATVVFRGTVTEKKTLPGRPEMRGRGRYAITFRVDEYWKGPRQTTIVIYGLDDGTDCMGGSSYEVGQNYLVFASQQSSGLVFLDSKTFWYGWADIVPKDSPVLIDTACALGGKVSEGYVRDALKHLGKGKHPSP